MLPHKYIPVGFTYVRRQGFQPLLFPPLLSSRQRSTMMSLLTKGITRVFFLYS